jgi:hypothetical protein
MNFTEHFDINHLQNLANQLQKGIKSMPLALSYQLRLADKKTKEELEKSTRIFDKLKKRAESNDPEDVKVFHKFKKQHDLLNSDVEKYTQISTKLEEFEKRLHEAASNNDHSEQQKIETEAFQELANFKKINGDR